MVTLVSALLALAASQHNVLYVYIATIPVIMFWSLDAYYLQMERKVRGVYNHVAGISRGAENEIEIKEFEVPLDKYCGGKYTYFCAFTSRTLMVLYTSMLALLCIIVWFYFM